MPTETRIDVAPNAPQRLRASAATRLREAGLLVAVLVVFIILSFTAPNFFTVGNFLDVLHSVALQGIVAWGMTLLIIGAEIDISVGPVVAFASVLLAILNTQLNVPLPLAVLLVLLEGTVVGLGAGFIRAYGNVPSFIVTLALWTSIRGLAFLVTNALPIPISSVSFQFWGAGSVAGIPVPAIIMLILFALFWFISQRTVFGRSVFAVGGNADAARLSGIPVTRIRVILFGITGLLSTLSGILLASWLGSGNPGAASGMEFDVIAAVIVGGTDLFGGRGTMFGTFLGVIFIGMLGNGLILLGVSPYVQDIVRGIIILVAVLVNTLIRRRSIT
ncbi:MAG: ABC transporter permease [Ktedonobacteraceae bacterium]|nr:ABC transporter permease [Ktedonobacteraceae bacterium]